MSRGRVLLAGVIRFFGLLVLAAGVVALGALAIMAITDSTYRRALALGFYGLGAFLLLSGFFIGNRGPVRLRGPVSAGSALPFFGVRKLRLASAAEQEESINLGAIFVALGVSLLALGAAADDAHSLT